MDIKKTIEEVLKTRPEETSWIVDYFKRSITPSIKFPHDDTPFDGINKNNVVDMWINGTDERFVYLLCRVDKKNVVRR